jgi:hypothetical protein
MKLNEINNYPKLNVNNAKIAIPDNTQNFSMYNAPLVGIEVEVENVRNHVNIEHSWTVNTDGSLRNSGLEFISLPTKPELIESAINHLFDKLPKEAHFSPRTSIHVHMNVRELTLAQIYNIVILYQCFEDLLYKFAGPERKKSIFCVPLGSTNYYINLRRNFVTRTDGVPWSKYTGLNLSPMNNYGTVEFRHLRGTNNRQTLFTWLHFLYNIWHFATSHSTDELESLIRESCNTRDYLGLGYLVFGDRFNILNNNGAYLKTMREDLAISKLFMSRFDYSKGVF